MLWFEIIALHIDCQIYGWANILIPGNYWTLYDVVPGYRGGDDITRDIEAVNTPNPYKPVVPFRGQTTYNLAETSPNNGTAVLKGLIVYPEL